MKKIFLISLFLLSLVTYTDPILVYAQTGGSGSTGGTGGTGQTQPLNISVKLDNPFSGANSLFDLLQKVINDILLPIGGILAVLAFIYSGFLYVTAQGKEAQIAKAHKALLYTSIGTAVLLGSWVLANVICKTIGLLGGPVCLP